MTLDNKKKIVLIYVASICYRHIKKERKYFLDNLSCRISRMKRDNSIEQLRGQKAKDESTKSQVEKSHNYDQVSYDEMIPGSPRRQLSLKSKYL